MYLDNKLLIKISDFGLSGCSKQKAKPRAYHRTDDGRLPMRWMALESLEEAQFNSATDVWGYGVTVWEIATLGMCLESTSCIEFPVPIFLEKLICYLENVILQ